MAIICEEPPESPEGGVVAGMVGAVVVYSMLTFPCEIVTQTASVVHMYLFMVDWTTLDASA